MNARRKRKISSENTALLYYNYLQSFAIMAMYNFGGVNMKDYLKIYEKFKDIKDLKDYIDEVNELRYYI